MDVHQIIRSFNYHTPNPGQIERFQDLRDTAKDFALLIHETCPESDETLIAISKVEEAVMWANKSIACNE
jgi:hypothetical protein